jgi:hypothetical protein
MSTMLQMNQAIQSIQSTAEEKDREMQNMKAEINLLKSVTDKQSRERKEEAEEQRRKLEAREAQIAKLRREKEALRKKSARMAERIPADQPTAREITNFKPIYSGEKVLLSTESIAEENDAAARSAGFGVTFETGGGGCEAAMDHRKRKPVQQTFRRIAMDSITYVTQGTNSKRACGGTCKNEASLFSMVIVWFTTWISIRALCNARPALLEASVQSARAVLTPRASYASRRALPSGKPVDITGHVSRKTLTDAIIAGLIALDAWLASVQRIAKSDVVTIQADSSSFNESHLLGLVITCMEFRKVGEDALKHPCHAVVMTSFSPFPLPCADKKVLDVRRDDGTLFEKEAAVQMVLQLCLSGHLFPLLACRCLYLNMDGGIENRGTGKGKNGAALRRAFLGRGSPLEQIFVTREAVDQVIHGMHGPLVSRIMEFFGLDPKPLEERYTRPSPRRLNTSGPVMSRPGRLVNLRREWDSASRKYSVISRVVEELKQRESIPRDPFSFLPMLEGGAPCGEYCDMHALGRAVVMYVKAEHQFFGLAMRVVSQLRDIFIHVRLKTTLELLCGSKKQASVDQDFVEGRIQLGDEFLEEARQIYPLCRQRLAADTRWGTVLGTVSDVSQKRRVVTPMLPIALAKGTEKNKWEVAKEVRTSWGFRERNLIQFSPKVGRMFRLLTTPWFILQVAITRFVHTVAFQPLLAACAHRDQCASSAMRGVGSLLRVILFLLQRGFFVAAGRKKSNPKWETMLRMAHRDPPTHRVVKGCMLFSNRLESPYKSRSIGQADPSKAKSELELMYREFYTSSIGSAASTLQQAMKHVVACEEGDILSPKNRAEYEQYVSSRNTGQAKALDPNAARADRFFAAQWLVSRNLCMAADCITRKLPQVLCCPLGFLAGLYDVEAVPLVLIEFDQMEDEGEEVLPFYIATSKALANANVLLCQLRELLGKYGTGVCEHFQEPLSILLRDLTPLEEFAKGNPVQLMGRGKVAAGHEGRSLPLPVTAFPTLCRCSLMAGARPTNNSGIEAKWSQPTSRYHGHARHTTAPFLAATFRQKDIQTAGANGMLNTDSASLEGFSEARKFLRTIRPEFTRAFASREAESRNRLNRSEKAKESYKKSNIQISFKGQGEGKDVPKKGAAPEKAARKRSSGKPATRHEPADSSESEDSADEYSWSENEGDSESEDEAGSAPEESEFEFEAEEYGAGDGPDDSDGTVAQETGHAPQRAGAGSESAEPAGGGENDSMSNRGAETMLNEPADSSGKEAVRGDSVRPAALSSEEGSTSDREPGAVSIESAGSSPSPSPSLEGAVGAGGAGDGRNDPSDSSGANAEGDPAGHDDGPAEDCDSEDSDNSDLEAGVFEDVSGWNEKDGDPVSETALFIHVLLSLLDQVFFVDPVLTFRARRQMGAVRHPLSDVPVRGQGTSAGPLKLDSICRRLEGKVWTDTLVQADGSRRPTRDSTAKCLMLTRDNISFPLISGESPFFYVLCAQDDAVELVQAEKLHFGVPEAAQDDHALGIKSSAREEWCMTYYRVRSTKEAADLSTARDYVHKTASGRGVLKSLGKKSLRDLLKDPKSTSRLLFHKGDLPYVSSAKFIVGLVAWDALPVGRAPAPDDKNLLLRRVVHAISSTSQKSSGQHSQRSVTIKTLDDIDWVFCGPDFSEPKDGR